MVPWKTQHISKNYFVEELKISTETTGGDVSWINGKNEI